MAGGGIIQLKDPEVAARVMAPKVQGTLVLDRVTRDEPLDLFVICSSLASIVGDFGQCDYAVGNRFVDAPEVGRMTTACVHLTNTLDDVLARRFAHTTVSDTDGRA